MHLVRSGQQLIILVEELRQAHGKPTFSIRTTVLYHCVGSSLFNIEFTDQSALFNVCKTSLSIGPDVLCYVLGKAMAILPFKCVGHINTPISYLLIHSSA